MMLCFCDADAGAPVSMNDIIVKVVATALKVRTLHKGMLCGMLCGNVSACVAM